MDPLTAVSTTVGIGEGLNSIFGGKGDSAGSMARQQRRHQYRLTRDINKNKLQWIVSDARKAGIHPLYALGAGVSSPSFSINPGTKGNGVSEGLNAVSRTLSAAAANKLDQLEARSRISANQAQAQYYKNQADLVQEQRIGSQVARTAQLSNVNQDAEKLSLPALGSVTTGPNSRQQVVEDHYGGVVGEVYGISRLIADLTRYVSREASESNNRKGDLPTTKGYKAPTQWVPNLGGM